ncbi:MAG: cytochrome c class [Thermoleophilia bacterium]|nr:cytochrome c class [Thermoleophilia bacterium]
MRCSSCRRESATGFDRRASGDSAAVNAPCNYRRQSRWFPSAIIFVVGAAMAASGCGGGSTHAGSASPATLKQGKQLFVQKCGQCHTLSDADTTGQVGPQLDGAGLDSRRVREQIKTGGGAMPPGLYSGSKAKAVAAYVAQASG